MLVAAAALVQVVARVTVIVFGLRRAAASSSVVASAFRRTTAGPAAGPAEAGPYKWDELRWALAASAARVSGTCLTQALAARVLLGWHGVPSRLVIGVRQSRLRLPALSPSFGGQAQPPEFHAWIESDEICIPAADPAYTPLMAWS
jgi:hypothetical protein